MEKYRQIAAAVQRRIDDGDLRPGDRVPSTREIVEQWGVAMATASRAIAELQQRGSVRSERGVGTVVIGKPSRRGKPSLPRGDALSAERITRTAIEIADEEGLAAVSIRRVAAAMGAAPMSLYRHVADKDELLVRMADAVCAEIELPATSDGAWRRRVEHAVRLLWAAFNRHPWFAQAMSMTRPQLLPSAMPMTEWMLDALEGAGMDQDAAFTAYLTLMNFVRGLALNVESEREAQALSGMDNEEWMDLQKPALREHAMAERFPRFAQLVADEYDFSLDALFEFGLRLQLDGLAAAIERQS